MKFVKALKELNKESALVAGGKGASLGEMLQAGIPVPAGYVVVASAFEEFIKRDKIKRDIETALNTVKPYDTNSVEKASKKIRALIMSKNIPEDIITEIKASFAGLHSKFVAVRSSATSEDSKSAAWAGQLETYLNTTQGTLLENVKRCWASLFTTRAIFYRFEKNLQEKNISVAVVVQRMVEPEVSGIAFSVHPVTQDSNQVVIEAGYGLGESIVSGQITPDTYIIKKTPMRIISKIISTQKKGIFRSAKGGSEWKQVENGANQKLNDKEILELTELVKKVEKHYGFPCDIEWARENGRFYIVQSRPITTLAENYKKEDSGVADKLVNKIKALGGWEYYVTRKFNWAVEQTQIEASQKPLQTKYLRASFPTTKYLVLNGDEYYNSKEAEEFANFFKNKFASDPNFFEKLSAKEFEIVSRINGYRNGLERLNARTLSDKALIACLNRFTEQYSASFVPAWMRPDSFLEGEVKALLEKEGLDGKKLTEAFEKIATYPSIRGVRLDYNDEPLSLLKIAQEAQAQGITNVDSLPSGMENELKKHAQNFSWLKGPVAYAFMEFNLKEYKNRLLSLIKENVALKISKICDVRSTNEIEYKRTIKKHKIRGRLLKLCEATRNFIFLRTYTTEASDHLFFVGRKVLLNEAARRLDLSESDVVMLSGSEIVDCLKGKKEVFTDLIEKRKKGFAILWLGGKITTMFGSEAIAIQETVNTLFRSGGAAGGESGYLKGMSASKGKITGKVRVLLSYADVSDFSKGEVLVTTMTTPDYIAAMEKASAFITDEGGITCHAAIVSREFNVPCIVGTKNATQVLKDGDFVEVDAGKGVVRILKKKSK